MARLQTRGSVGYAAGQDEAGSTTGRGRTRRMWLAATASLGTIGGGVMASCAAPGGGVAQGGIRQRSETYTVRLQVWGDIQDKDVYDNIAADFGAAQSGIRIENDHQASGPGVPGYYDKFAANLAAGTAPDVAYFQGWMWQEYAAKDALQPLDDLAARDKWSTSWPNDQAYDLQTRYRSKRYMSPSNVGTMVMYYVKEYFDRAGIPYPAPEWTYADFQDLCRRLTRQVDGQQVYAYQWNGGYLRNTPWWRMQDHLEWDRIAEPRKALWNAAAVIEAYQYQLYDSQYRLQISPTQAMLAADANSNRIEFGNVVMKVEGPWFLPRMWGPQAKREGGTPFDVQLLPRGKVARTPHMNLIEGQAMTKQSKDKDAAWDVIKWIAGEQGQRRIAEGGRMCNVAEMSRKFWLPSVKEKYNLGNADAFLKAIDLGTINLVGAVTENVINRDAELGQAVNDIRDGKVTAREAMEQVQPKIQQVLDTYWATQAS
ncbi:MAG TPA: extracellular solute-binding protein [Chloroflexota bacterium]|nr:extracellular solute-binding protein [Chloroflexota bacterium]